MLTSYFFESDSKAYSLQFEALSINQANYSNAYDANNFEIVNSFSSNSILLDIKSIGANYVYALIFEDFEKSISVYRVIIDDSPLKCDVRTMIDQPMWFQISGARLIGSEFEYMAIST